MKLILFNKVIFEGTKEECNAYKKEMTNRLMRFSDELDNTFPIRKNDTWETYYEALKVLNPFVYETITWYKDVVGENFVAFSFRRGDMVGLGIWYRDFENPKRVRFRDFGFIFNAIVLEITKQDFWRVEE